MARIQKVKQILTENLVPETAPFGSVFVCRDTQQVWIAVRSEEVLNLSDLLDGKNVIASKPAKNGRDGIDGRDAKGERGQPGADGIDGRPGRDGRDAVGIAGPQGRAGRDGIDGKNGVGFKFRKNWSGDEKYFVNDVAVFEGSSWICLHDTDKHQAPPAKDNHDWFIFAAGGLNGRDGAKGATGDVQVIGADEAQVELQKLRQKRADNYARLLQHIEDNDKLPPSFPKHRMRIQLKQLLDEAAK